MVLGVLYVCVPQMSVAEEVDSASLKSEKQNYQNKLENVEQKLEEIQNQEHTTQKEKKEAQKRMERLKRKIETYNTKIEDLNSRIAEVKRRIGDTKQNIEEMKQSISELEAKIDTKKERVSQLIQKLYTQNTLQNEIYALAQSQSLSQALRDVSFSLTLQQKIRNELQAITDHRNSLDERKTELAYQKSQLSEKQKLLRQKRIEKETKKNQSEIAATEQKQEVNQLARKEQRLSARERTLRDKKRKFYQKIQSLEQRLATQANSPLGSIKWPAPAYTQDISYCSQGYGMTATAQQGYYGGQIHNGIDIASGVGTPIYAVADGTVIGRSQAVCSNSANKSCGAGWGNWVAVEHSSGHVSVYAHLSGAPLVAQGASVQKGQQVGRLGNSGFSTGAHLHFSIYDKYSVVDESGYNNAPAYNPSGTIDVQQIFDVSCRE